MSRAPNPPARFSEITTPYLDRLIAESPEGAIAMQFLASEAEGYALPYELSDPLGEDAHAPAPRVIRKYANRALLLVTDTCAAHCRYCFRRSFTGSHRGVVLDSELEAAIEYLASQSSIEELLLSGGDPLTIGPSRLASILSRLRLRLPTVVFRICTRLPGVAPEKIGDALVEVVRAAAPVWLVVQINHPDELSQEVGAAFARFIDSGVPVVSQTVLLRGINDSTEVLAELFEGLVRLRVKPYQLFQTDLVVGTSHLRVPLARGVAIYGELKRRVSTLALPVYAVDAPGGGGKIALDRRSLERREGGFYLIEDLDGRLHRYPDESHDSPPR